MTDRLLACANPGCGTVMRAKEAADDIGHVLIGVCRRCGFVTSEHRFENSRFFGNAFEARKGVSSHDSPGAAALGFFGAC